MCKNWERLCKTHEMPHISLTFLYTKAFLCCVVGFLSNLTVETV